MNTQVDDINDAIISLWKRNFAQDADTWLPLVYAPLTPHALLYIGLNPSFTDSWAKELSKVIPKGIDAKTFFHWRNRDAFVFKVAQELEEYSRENYKRYFGKLKTLAKDIQLPWEHIDLFFYRETKQHKLKPLVGIEKDVKSLSPFGRDQIDLAKSLIERADPKIIVVANVLASKLFALEYKISFDSITGYHRTQINGKEVPTFFSSMLTGGRALDNFSFARLKWHIMQAKEQLT